MDNFIKVNNRITIKPNGIDYSLDPNKTYNILYDDWNCVIYLEETNNLKFPENYYEIKELTDYKERIVKSFTTNDKNLGLLFSGIKGSGKTLFAKICANSCNVPILIVNNFVPTSRLLEFIEKLTTPVCLIFDEFEKNEKFWKSEDLLKITDGITNSCKLLIILTTNSINKLNCNLFDRCSRIKYHITFTTNNSLKLVDYIAKCKNYTNTENLDFIKKRLAILSIDNINSILDESLMFPDISIEEIIKPMNLTLR